MGIAKITRNYQITLPRDIRKIISVKEGDEIRTSSSSGKVKVLENFLGKKVKELTPSSPASVFGFESLPSAGEEFFVGEPPTKEVAAEKEELVEVPTEENKVKAVLKADTSGSLEVLSQVIGHLVKVTDMSVGGITDGDVKLAVSSGSIVAGFGVKANKAAESVA